MTTDAWSPGVGAGVTPVGAGAPSTGAAGSELRAAAESIASALRGLGAADDVAWVSTAATRYRAVLAEGAAALRATEGALDEAITAVAVHDAAVERGRLARYTALAAGASAGASGRGSAGGSVGASVWALSGASLAASPASWQDISRAVDLRAGPDAW